MWPAAAEGRDRAAGQASDGKEGHVPPLARLARGYRRPAATLARRALTSGGSDSRCASTSSAATADLPAVRLGMLVAVGLNPRSLEVGEDGLGLAIGRAGQLAPGLDEREDGEPLPGVELAAEGHGLPHGGLDVARGDRHSEIAQQPLVRHRAAVESEHVHALLEELGDAARLRELASSRVR